LNNAFKIRRKRALHTSTEAGCQQEEKMCAHGLCLMTDAASGEAASASFSNCFLCRPRHPMLHSWPWLRRLYRGSPRGVLSSLVANAFRPLLHVQRIREWLLRIAGRRTAIALRKFPSVRDG
jgi:hypothetical protein